LKAQRKLIYLPSMTASEFRVYGEGVLVWWVRAHDRHHWEQNALHRWGLSWVSLTKGLVRPTRGGHFQGFWLIRRTSAWGSIPTCTMRDVCSESFKIPVPMYMR
jgi:hypothetical protein